MRNVMTKLLGICNLCPVTKTCLFVTITIHSPPPPTTQADQLTEEQIAGKNKQVFPTSPFLLVRCPLCTSGSLTCCKVPELSKEMSPISCSGSFHVAYREHEVKEHWKIRHPPSLSRSLSFQNEQDIRGRTICSNHKSRLKPVQHIDGFKAKLRNSLNHWGTLIFLIINDGKKVKAAQFLLTQSPSVAN